MAKQIFGRTIEPRCRYCEHGRPMTQEDQILCPHKGPVRDDFHCRRFVYDPTRRTPPPPPPRLPQFSAEDFRLD